MGGKITVFESFSGHKVDAKIFFPDFHFNLQTLIHPAVPGLELDIIRRGYMVYVHRRSLQVQLHDGQAKRTSELTS